MSSFTFGTAMRYVKRRPTFTSTNDDANKIIMDHQDRVLPSSICAGRWMSNESDKRSSSSSSACWI